MAHPGIRLRSVAATGIFVAALSMFAPVTMAAPADPHPARTEIRSPVEAAHRPDRTTSPPNDQSTTANDRGTTANTQRPVPDTEGPAVTDNPFLPADQNVTDCVGTLELPNCGSPKKSDVRLYLTFAVLMLGMAFIGWRIARIVRRRDRADVAPDHTF